MATGTITIRPTKLSIGKAVTITTIHGKIKMTTQSCDYHVILAHSFKHFEALQLHGLLGLLCRGATDIEGLVVGLQGQTTTSNNTIVQMFPSYYYYIIITQTHSYA